MFVGLVDDHVTGPLLISSPSYRRRTGRSRTGMPWALMPFTNAVSVNCDRGRAAVMSWGGGPYGDLRRACTG